ncbi:MAG TPA: 16S rRNA pseudouridine(516) synthase [Rubrivivax sp.]|mgnify:CR=1 FL=1|nr:16S rRNA pseudouridine(516) synthase [Rubrivivax sp.]
MQLRRILFSQGFGSRRECEALILNGRVQVGGLVVDDPDADIDTGGLMFSVQGRPWPFHAKALLMLNKPAGYECSQKPRHHPSVLSLLPLPLRRRGVQPIGRLDQDTTGLLLLSDDGALIHELTSPRRHVPKVYRADCADAVTPHQLQQLRAGVLLRDDPMPVRAAACEAGGERQLLLTLTEGKYHQVKRMLAAVGNRVVALQRVGFGALQLPEDLPPGQWRWVERAAITPGAEAASMRHPRRKASAP